MESILSIDIGTTKICALLMDAVSMETIAVSTVRNTTALQGLPAGHHELDPDEIINCCKTAVSNVMADPKANSLSVASIAVTGMMHGIMLVDNNIKPVTNYISWRDRRTDDMARAFDMNTSHTAGCCIHPGFGALTIKWLHEHGMIPPSAKAISIMDYLAASLTGVTATEVTHAASWGLLDLKHLTWNSDILKRLQIPGWVLPDLNPSACPLGTILNNQASLLGIEKGITVYSPVADNQAGFIGAAGLRDDVLVVNIGTGGQISLLTEDIAVVEGLETRPMPNGAYIIVGTSLCGGLSYAYMKDFYKLVIQEFTDRNPGDEEIYGRMNMLAQLADPECDYLLTDTRFDGTRGGSSIRGSISGIDTQNFTPANLTRSTLNGMVRELFTMIKRVNLNRITTVIAIGNAVRKNHVVLDIIARHTKLPCTTSVNSEEAARGAAIACLGGKA